MAIVINGSGTITGLSAGGLPDGSVDSDTLATGIDATKLADGTVTSAELQYINTLSSNAQTQIDAGGKVLQIKQDTLTTTETISSTTWADLSNLSVSITPTATDSDILVMGHLSAGNGTTGQAQFRLRRDSTDISLGTTATSSRVDGTFGAYQNDSNSTTNCSFAFVDVPATTSAVQYHFQWRGSDSGAKYVNRSFNDNDGGYNLRTNSTIIVMEISGGLS